MFILNLTPGFNGLSEDKCKRIQETFKLGDLVRFILEVLHLSYMRQQWGGKHIRQPLANQHFFMVIFTNFHYSDVKMSVMASLITSPTSVYSTVHPGAEQRQHQGSASLAFVRGIHRRPVNSPHQWPVTRKVFPFDDVIMMYRNPTYTRVASHPFRSSTMSRGYESGKIISRQNRKRKCYPTKW